VKSVYKSKKQYQELLEEHVGELSKLQQLHYASHRYALLLIFQGMDAGGKDGAIRHVMSGVNPQGCQIFSFKQPSADGLEHDFLWRTTLACRNVGGSAYSTVPIYEEVLVVRVHKEILRGEGLPKELLDEKDMWKERYRSILAWKATSIARKRASLRSFWHLSKNEQRQRIQSTLVKGGCWCPACNPHKPACTGSSISFRE
jgi:polyphosphate kinase 2 (PPK2 family)